MTFKMLIVDDEPIICRGLQLTVPWEEHQIEAVAIAHDGVEAIEKLNAHPDIHLVITDVRMPNMDGLELATYISKNHPDIRMIMLSGYDEFKYAQKAIQLGVKDYLLKPVEVQELLEVVDKITQELQVEQVETEEAYFTKLMNAIHHQVFDFQMKDPEVVTLFEDVHVYPFLTMVKDYKATFMEMSEDEVQNLKLEWNNMLTSQLDNLGLSSVSIFTSENRLLTCIIGDENNFTYQDVSLMVKDIQHPSFSLLFVLSETMVPFRDLSDVYQTLSHDRRYLPLCSDGRVVSPVKDIPILGNHSDEMESNLIQAIFQNEQDEVKKAITQLFTFFKKHRFLLSNVVDVCSELIERIHQRYESIFRKGTKPWELHFQQTIDVDLYNSYDLLMDLFHQDMDQVLMQLDMKAMDNKDWLMEKAENYIKSYYTSHLKAHEVADFINISPNYFSSLFKQKTSKSFNEYINELRVEKAKELLKETPFKVNEIAEKVGYHEYKYFVDVFKRITGLTPTKYRKLTS